MENLVNRQAATQNALIGDQGLKPFCFDPLFDSLKRNPPNELRLR